MVEFFVVATCVLLSLIISVVVGLRFHMLTIHYLRKEQIDYLEHINQEIEKTREMLNHLNRR